MKFTERTTDMYQICLFPHSFNPQLDHLWSVLEFMIFFSHHKELCYRLQGLLPHRNSWVPATILKSGQIFCSTRDDFVLQDGHKNLEANISITLLGIQATRIE